MFINSPWNAYAPSDIGSVAERVRARKGVAILKVDADVCLKHRPSVGPGWSIQGFRNPAQRGGCAGAVIKARFGKEWVCPRDLHMKKIFYRFYHEKDRNGNRRPYLFLACRPEDAVYHGTRRLVISARGVFLIPDRALGAALRESDISAIRDDADLALPPSPWELIEEEFDEIDQA
jgi:hypothetical protein